MPGRHRIRGHVRRWHGSWQVVLETGEQPYRQCPICREETRADGRRKGSRRWWLAEGAAPTVCPDCDAELLEETDRRQEKIGGFDRRRDAEDELARIVANDRMGRTADRHGMSLADWLERWLDIIADSVKIGELAPRTAAGYESHVRNYLRPRLGHVELAQLTPADVSNLMRTIQAEGRAAATAVRVRATLSRALSDAMRHELVHRNAAKIAKPPRVAKKAPSAFSRKELTRVLEALEGHRLRALYLLAVYTGLRASELCALRWSNIDLDDATYQVRASIHRLGRSAARVVPETGMVESRPKTDDSGNTLPLSRQAVDLLREHRDRQDRERGDSHVPWPDDDYVFTTTIGTPLEYANVLKAWKEILAEAEVDYRGPGGRGRGLHELRRTFATRLRDRGIPLEDVQRLGRWASPQVLLELYSASDEQRLRRAAEGAADAIDGP